MVTKREALEELSLRDLQKVADRLGVRVSKGVTGLLTQAMFGSPTESKRPYVEALSSSDVVTLESIDRILHTRYSRLPDDTRGVGRVPRQQGILSGILTTRKPEVSRFYTLDSLLQHILDQYATKSDLQKMCRNLGIPGTGNKSDLVTKILNDSRLTREMALYCVSRDNMRKLSEDMRLPPIGTRREMESRILNAMMQLPSAPINHPSYARQQSYAHVTPTYQVAYQPPDTAKSHIATNSPDSEDRVALTGVPDDTTLPGPPEHEIMASPMPSVSEAPPSETIPLSAGFDDIFRFIDEWRPTKPYRDEAGYEVELDTRLRARFGDACVKNQLHVSAGRIDIEAMGIGIELKVPTNKAMLQRLIGQTMMYRKHYGPNLIVVIITGKAKLQDVLAFKSDLETVGTRVVTKSG